MMIGAKTIIENNTFPLNKLLASDNRDSNRKLFFYNSLMIHPVSRNHLSLLTYIWLNLTHLDLILIS